ncbi:MAG: hypothetical protein HC817_01650 [Saprospiraceae bacterium]|nr:hypothetical protein [Saprospiraceae bacterium]
MKNLVYDHIELFIKGELREPHLLNFELELMNNPEFCKEVRLRIMESDVVNAIKLQNRIDKLEIWRVQLAQLVQKEAAEKAAAEAAEAEKQRHIAEQKLSNERKKRYDQWQKWAIAASILIVFGCLYAIFFPQKTTMKIY